MPSTARSEGVTPSLLPVLLIMLFDTVAVADASTWSGVITSTLAPAPTLFA